jgi:predicted HicB family RNase H-like nuclease
MRKKTCSECGKPWVAKGLCPTHYQNQRRRALGAKPRPGGKMVKRTFRIPKAFKRVAAHLAKEEGLSLSEWVRQAVEQAVR